MIGPDRALLECSKCHHLKSQKKLQSNCYFFKRYAPMKKEDITDAAISLENVFLTLPLIHQGDDIYKIVQNELMQLKESKEKEKNAKAIKIFESFITNVDRYREEKYLRNSDVIKQARDMVELYMEQRLNHKMYLQDVEECNNFIQDMTEEAKINFTVYKKSIEAYLEDNNIELINFGDLRNEQ